MVSVSGYVMFVGGNGGVGTGKLDTIYSLGCVTDITCAWERLDATLSQPKDNVLPLLVPNTFLDCRY